MRSESAIWPHHRIAGESPLREIVRLDDGKHLAKRLAFGLLFAGADGIIRIAGFPDERVGKVTAVNRVVVNKLRSCERHNDEPRAVCAGAIVGIYPRGSASLTPQGLAPSSFPCRGHVLNLKKSSAVFSRRTTQFSAETRGRTYAEPPPEWRTQYQRDRDRVIHSRAFRRLEYKTQVFLNGTGDHLRTRLTHTMEVAAVARNIARPLRLNADLAETIALAHDLGHSPFGHKGETVLDQLMKGHGGL